MDRRGLLAFVRAIGVGDGYWGRRGLLAFVRAIGVIEGYWVGEAIGIGEVSWGRRGLLMFVSSQICELARGILGSQKATAVGEGCWGR